MRAMHRWQHASMETSCSSGTHLLTSFSRWYKVMTEATVITLRSGVARPRTMRDLHMYDEQGLSMHCYININACAGTMHAPEGRRFIWLGLNCLCCNKSDQRCPDKSKCTGALHRDTAQAHQSACLLTIRPGCMKETIISLNMCSCPM